MYHYNGKVYSSAPEELKQKWIAFGERMGYPSCCIDAFYHGTQVKGDKNMYEGTGFTPCVDCSKKSTKEVVNHIDTHRRVEFPFPCDTAEEKERLELSFPIILKRVDAMRKGCYTHDLERLLY